MTRGFSNVAFSSSPVPAKCACRCLGLILTLPAVSALVANHGTTVTRTCSDGEVAEYALLLAVGPAKAPACVPASGQSLRAPELPSLQSPGSGAGAFAQQALSHSTAEGGMHFAHLHVVKSDANWCAPPCDAPSWELSAPNPEKGSPYLLLQAAIWNQFRKVTLYQFDAEWEKTARNSYRRLCGSTAWGCPAYTNHRETRALLTVGPWPLHLHGDAKGLSAWIKEAFVKVFDEVHKHAGKDNSRIGFTYSGHGGDADGSLFAGAVNPEDAVSLFRSQVDTGGKFSIFNFGTNCQEGRWNMLAAMYPFAEWILASDLKVGGLKATEPGEHPKEEQAQLKAKNKLSDVAMLKQSMEARQTPKEAAAAIVEARRQMWLGAFKKDLTEQKLRQSISVFAASKFPALATAMESAYARLPQGTQEDIVAESEKQECDVLNVAQFMDSAGASMMLQQNRTMLRKAAGSLEARFRAFRVEYASTRSLFTWTPVTHGLGYNFRGAWNINGVIIPRCDLTSLHPLAR